jgi:aryl-alcohol dehydrogenase-like predicted oxidoreductase
MERRTLGRTGLEVSLLTFGCGAVGGLMTKGRPEDQRTAVVRALEAGVNIFDTAPLYGNGASEKNLGRILAELRPDIVLATKVRIAPHDKADIAAAITASLDRSLARLGRDHVDLFQLHNTLTAAGEGEDLTPDLVLAEVVPAFERERRAGRVRFIGMTAIGETDALHRVVGAGVFDTAQIVYNLLNPSAGAPVPAGYPGQDYASLLGLARAADMGTIVIRALAGGALSGSEARHPLSMPVVAPIGSGADYATDVARARAMAPVAAAATGGSLVELAIRYVASHADVSTFEVGMATVAEFEGAAAAAGNGPLTDDALVRIARVQVGYSGNSP